MTTPRERVDALLAAAVTDDLDADESAELDALLAARPDLRTELDALRGTVARLDDWSRSGGAWADVATPALPAPVVGSEGVGVPARRRRARLVAAAVALVAVGSAATLGVQAVADRAVEGPPGTLGAVEPLAPVTSDDSPLPGRVDASFVAHTWGTETVLDVHGTRPGEVYAVYVVEADGREVEAGAFLGTSVPIHCSLNAAVLREDVVGLRITDASGATVATASAPRV